MGDTGQREIGMISRRAFLRAMATGTVGLSFGGVLAACQAPPPPAQPATKAAAPAAAQAPAPTAAPKPVAGGIATVAIGTDPVTLDPHVSGDNEASILYIHLHDLLFRFDDKGGRVPDLAESIEPSGDGLAWTVTLKKGIKFHDGTPFNAEAVKRSFERHMDPKAKRDNAVLPAIQTIQAVNETTVKFVTKEPFAAFRNVLVHSTTGIVSPAAAEKLGENYTNAPVGTGAYMFKERVRGERVVMVANPEYRGGRPKLDQVIWRTIKEDATRVLAIEAGEVDAALRVPPTEIEHLRRVPNVEVLVNEGQRIMFMAVNVTHKPFDDRRVRLALNYAVDKEAIIKNVIKGAGQLMRSPMAPKVWGYVPVGAYEFNPEKAKQLLKEAGAEGLVIKMAASEGKEPFERQVAEAVHGQYLAIGLKAELRIIGDYPAYRQAAERGEFDMVLDAYGISDGDANKPLSALLEGKYANKAGQRNYSAYQNPQLDKLLEAGRVTMDETQRRKIYEDAQRLVFEDAPWVFLHTNNMYHAVRKNLQGVGLPANDKLDLRSAWKQG